MLLAAGAIVHVVQDTASPARVRDDRGAMLDRVGPDASDVGSRFERLASLSFGRLGVPRAARAIPLRPALADYITSDASDGLADRVARAFMSENTLPRPIRASVDMRPELLERRLEASLRRPFPRPASPLDLRAAADERGAVLRSEGGVCVAHYHLRDNELRWSIPDACALEQISVLLAEASAYGAGVLDWLLRGELDVRARGDGLEVTSLGLGVREAELTLYWQDARGLRTGFAKLEVADSGAGETIARVARPPAGAERVVALLRGIDEHGQAIVASGSSRLCIHAPRTRGSAARRHRGCRECGRRFAYDARHG
jgi:hypothetical protein